VIYYHDIVENGSGFSLMRTDVENFLTQMEFLINNGYKTMLFSELPFDMKKGKKEKKVLITFDDGFESNYHRAFPIIKSLGIKINIFLAYDYIDRENYLSSDQIIEMQNSGFVEFGYHTKTHCDCRQLVNSKTIEKEIVEGLNDTEKIVQSKISEFCFPFGYYNKDIIKSISDCQRFKHQFTSNYIKPVTVNNCVICGRIGIDNNWDIETFAKSLEGKYRIMHFYSKMRVGVPKVK
jgi:peptidoglycan/xylan/chitin deacetylase (PgdA/CDA1 family)